MEFPVRVPIFHVPKRILLSRTSFFAYFFPQKNKIIKFQNLAKHYIISSEGKPVWVIT